VSYAASWMVYIRPAVGAVRGGVAGELLVIFVVVVVFVARRAPSRGAADALETVGAAGRGLGVTGTGIVDTGAGAVDAVVVGRAGEVAGVVAATGAGRGGTAGALAATDPAPHWRP
jgi:hypothetical protein